MTRSLKGSRSKYLTIKLKEAKSHNSKFFIITKCSKQHPWCFELSTSSTLVAVLTLYRSADPTLLPRTRSCPPLPAVRPATLLATTAGVHGRSVTCRTHETFETSGVSLLCFLISAIYYRREIILSKTSNYDWISLNDHVIAGICQVLCLFSTFIMILNTLNEWIGAKMPLRRGWWRWMASSSGG